MSFIRDLRARVQQLPLPRTAFSTLLVLIVLAGLVRSELATGLDSLQIDEAWHAVAGVSYVQRGDFRLNPEHPPLVKLWVGAALSSSFELPPFRALDEKQDERLFVESAFHLDNDSLAAQRIVRYAMLAFHGLLLCALGFTLRRAFGATVALCTLALLLLDPTVAAHLPVILTDLPLTLLSAITVLLAYFAFRDFRARDLALTALALGLALATKHTALLLAAAVAAAGLASAVASGRALPRLARVAALLAAAYAILWACYGLRFDERSTATAQLTAAPAPQQPSAAAQQATATAQPSAASAPPARAVAPQQANAAAEQATAPTGQLNAALAPPEQAAATTQPPAASAPPTFNRSLEDKVADIEAPLARELIELAADWQLLPRAYLWGLADIVRAGLEARTDVVLLGQRYRGGAPWFYFPVVLATKLPLLFILLALIGACLRPTQRAPLYVLCAWAALHLTMIMRGNSAYAGVRHALPVYPALALLAAAALTFAWPRSKLTATSVLAVLALSALPHMRPWEYYNELVGGSAGAWHYFDDEGVDSGQRVRELVQFYNQHLRNAGEPVYDYYGLGEVDLQASKINFNDIEELSESTTTLEGTVFVGVSSLIPAPLYDQSAFRAAAAQPYARFGNLFVLRGKFEMPWLPAARKMKAANELLEAAPSDAAQAKELLREVARIYPQDYTASFELANLLVREGDLPGALSSYTLALAHAPSGDRIDSLVSAQIERMKHGEHIEPIRSPWLE